MRFYNVRDFLDRNEKPAFLGKFVNNPAFAGINSADRRRRIFGKRSMAGKIPAIDPEDRAKRQHNHKSRQDEKTENRPEK